MVCETGRASDAVDVLWYPPAHERFEARPGSSTYSIEGELVPTLPLIACAVAMTLWIRVTCIPKLLDERFTLSVGLELGKERSLCLCEENVDLFEPQVVVAR